MGGEEGGKGQVIISRRGGLMGWGLRVESPERDMLILWKANDKYQGD